MELSRELIERVAKAAGKTLEDFDREVAEQRGESLINQDVASIGEVVSFLIINAEVMAQVNTEVMVKLFEAESRISELEEKLNA